MHVMISASIVLIPQYTYAYMYYISLCIIAFGNLWFYILTFWS